MRPIAVTVSEAIALTGIGRTTLYREINAGRLKPRKSGRRTLFLVADLEAYVQALPLAANEGAGGAADA